MADRDPDGVGGLTVGLIARALATVAIAALVAGLPMSLLVTIDLDAELRPAAIANMMLMTLAYVACVGLPAALLVFYWVRRMADFGLGQLLLTGNALGLALVLLVSIAMGSFGAVFLGIPIMLAANAFAIAGWLLVLKPYRSYNG